MGRGLHVHPPHPEDLGELGVMKIPGCAVPLALSLAVLLAPRIAHVTHVTKEISLSDVIAQSHWICSAEYLGPDKQVHAGHRFKKVETLLNKMKSKKAPDEFVVVTPWAVANATVQRVHKTTGVRRFPLIYRMTGGAKFPGKVGGKLILFLKEHDEKVVVLTAENAALPASEKESVAELESADLIFTGKVVSIEIAPLKGSRHNFVVKTRVLKVLKGSFKGTHFSFRIHSPAKWQMEVGKVLEVKAKRTKDGYLVDPLQFLKR
jgi:hypothetical protein